MFIYGKSQYYIVKFVSAKIFLIGEISLTHSIKRECVKLKCLKVFISEQNMIVLDTHNLEIHCEHS